MSSSAVVLEKGLPANLDAERFVLGSILMDDSYYIQTAGALQPDDFSLEKHRRIFARMAEVHDRGEKIDRVTLANELMSRNQLESCDGLSYLVSLDDGLPQTFNIESYIRIVKDKAILTALVRRWSSSRRLRTPTTTTRPTGARARLSVDLPATATRCRSREIQPMISTTTASTHSSIQANGSRESAADFRSSTR